MEFDPIGRLRSTLNSALSTLGSEKASDESEEGSVDSSGDASSTEAATDGGTQVANAGVDVGATEFARMDPEDALYLLLCQEGGKMKQSQMVTATGWSKSKVSRRLSDLEDAGRIGRVRQGREKVVFVKPGTDDAN